MNNDNGVINTGQDQTNKSTASTPFDGSPTSQFPQNNNGTNQAYQPSGVSSSQPSQVNNNVPPVEDSELQEIKRSALQNLLPIVGKLDQSPEERFQTLLMVIQASDNRELINEAYETAAKISDEGRRAQALLAIINEINFFTQPAQN